MYTHIVDSKHSSRVILIRLQPRPNKTLVCMCTHGVDTKHSSTVDWWSLIVLLHLKYCIAESVNGEAGSGVHCRDVSGTCVWCMYLPISYKALHNKSS